MRSDYTHVSIVLDRSGSMSSCRDDTMGGFNQFLADQKAQPGKATLTLVQFDDRYQIDHNGAPLQSVKPLNGESYVPRGTTALLDAIGRTIDETGRYLADMPESERPSKVVFVILTDGQENASRERSLKDINAAISRQRDSYGWKFVFLGADQDAIASASKMGIGKHNTMSYAKGETYAAINSVTDNLRAYRAGTAQTMHFTASQRNAQATAGAADSFATAPDIEDKTGTGKA